MAVLNLLIIQPAFTCSKLAIEALEQGVNYDQTQKRYPTSLTK